MIQCTCWDFALPVFRCISRSVCHSLYTIVHGATVLYGMCGVVKKAEDRNKVGKPKFKLRGSSHETIQIGTAQEFKYSKSRDDAIRRMQFWVS